jgi:hypothetical protein
LARLTRALGLLALLCISACKSAAVESSQAARPKEDEPAIRAILAADQKLDRALKDADDEAAKGNDALAADALDKKALPAANDAIGVAEGQSVQSAWGRTQKDALLGSLRDRKAEIPRYAQALRGDDLEAKLAAVEKQVALEKKAMEVARAASSPPE